MLPVLRCNRRADMTIMGLQMRHPLALAHYANHPAAGTKPNVMVAAFSFTPRPGTPYLKCREARLSDYLAV